MSQLTEDSILDALNEVIDPELRVGIVDLGLVYNVTITDENDVEVEMTLTSPGCPAGAGITNDATEAIQAVPGVNKAIVEVVWDPPWNVNMMSDFAKDELGIP